MKFVANFASSINLNYLQSCRKIEFVIEKSLAELARWQDHARKAFENNLREFFVNVAENPAQMDMATPGLSNRLENQSKRREADAEREGYPIFPHGFFMDIFLVWMFKLCLQPVHYYYGLVEVPRMLASRSMVPSKPNFADAWTLP